jgi:hypothetical protein
LRLSSAIFKEAITTEPLQVQNRGRIRAPSEKPLAVERSVLRLSSSRARALIDTALAIMKLEWWTLSALAVVLTGCARPQPVFQAQITIPSRFELVSVNGLDVPAVDTVLGERVFSGAIEIYHSDTLRVVHTFRARPYDRFPCAALRPMAASKATAGLEPVTDTVTAGCEHLRLIETDTQVVAYEQRGQRLHTADHIARVIGDTIIVEEEVRDVTLGGPTRTRTRSLRYVRVATPPASREPQN